jgi:hypothetical protein
MGQSASLASSLAMFAACYKAAAITCDPAAAVAKVLATTAKHGTCSACILAQLCHMQQRCILMNVGNSLSMGCQLFFGTHCVLGSNWSSTITCQLHPHVSSLAGLALLSCTLNAHCPRHVMTSACMPGTLHSTHDMLQQVVCSAAQLTSHPHHVPHHAISPTQLALRCRPSAGASCVGMLFVISTMLYCLSLICSAVTFLQVPALWARSLSSRASRTASRKTWSGATSTQH